MEETLLNDQSSCTVFGMLIFALAFNLANTMVDIWHMTFKSGSAMSSMASFCFPQSYPLNA